MADKEKNLALVNEEIEKQEAEKLFSILESVPKINFSEIKDENKKKKLILLLEDLAALGDQAGLDYEKYKTHSLSYDKKGNKILKNDSIAKKEGEKRCLEWDKKNKNLSIKIDEIRDIETNLQFSFDKEIIDQTFPSTWRQNFVFSNGKYYFSFSGDNTPYRDCVFTVKNGKINIEGNHLHLRFIEGKLDLRKVSELDSLIINPSNAFSVDASNFNNLPKISINSGADDIDFSNLESTDSLEFNIPKVTPIDLPKLKTYGKIKILASKAGSINLKSLSNGGNLEIIAEQVDSLDFPALRKTKNFVVTLSKKAVVRFNQLEVDGHFHFKNVNKLTREYSHPENNKLQIDLPSGQKIKVKDYVILPNDIEIIDKEGNSLSFEQVFEITSSSLANLEVSLSANSTVYVKNKQSLDSLINQKNSFNFKWHNNGDWQKNTTFVTSDNGKKYVMTTDFPDDKEFDFIPLQDHLAEKEKWKKDNTLLPVVEKNLTKKVKVHILIEGNDHSRKPVYFFTARNGLISYLQKNSLDNQFDFKNQKKQQIEMQVSLGSKGNLITQSYQNLQTLTPYSQGSFDLQEQLKNTVGQYDQMQGNKLVYLIAAHRLVTLPSISSFHKDNQEDINIIKTEWLKILKEKNVQFHAVMMATNYTDNFKNSLLWYLAKETNGSFLICEDRNEVGKNLEMILGRGEENDNDNKEKLAADKKIIDQTFPPAWRQNPNEDLISDEDGVYSFPMNVYNRFRPEELIVRFTIKNNRINILSPIDLSKMHLDSRKSPKEVNMSVIEKMQGYLNIASSKVEFINVPNLNSVFSVNINASKAISINFKNLYSTKYGGGIDILAKEANDINLSSLHHTDALKIIAPKVKFIDLPELEKADLKIEIDVPEADFVNLPNLNSTDEINIKAKKATVININSNINNLTIGYIDAPNLKKPILGPTSFLVHDINTKSYKKLGKNQKYINGKIEQMTEQEIKLKKIKDTMINAFDGEDEFIKSILSKNKLPTKYNFENIKESQASINNFLHYFLYALKRKIKEINSRKYDFPKDFSIPYDSYGSSNALTDIKFKKLKKEKMITLSYPLDLLDEHKGPISITFKDLLIKDNRTTFYSRKSYCNIDYHSKGKSKEIVPKNSEEILLAFEPYLEDLIYINKILNDTLKKNSIRKEKLAADKKIIDQTFPPAWRQNPNEVLIPDKNGVYKLIFKKNKFEHSVAKFTIKNGKIDALNDFTLRTNEKNIDLSAIKSAKVIFIISKEVEKIDLSNLETGSILISIKKALIDLSKLEHNKSLEIYCEEGCQIDLSSFKECEILELETVNSEIKIPLILNIKKYAFISNETKFVDTNNNPLKKDNIFTITENINKPIHHESIMLKENKTFYVKSKKELPMISNGFLSETDYYELINIPHKTTTFITTDDGQKYLFVKKDKNDNKDPSKIFPLKKDKDFIPLEECLKREWQKANIPNAPLEKLIKQSIPPHKSFVFNSQGILTEGDFNDFGGFDINTYPQIKSFLPNYLKAYIEEDKQIQDFSLGYINLGSLNKGIITIPDQFYVSTNSKKLLPAFIDSKTHIAYLHAPKLQEPLYGPVDFKVFNVNKWIELTKGKKYVGGKVEQMTKQEIKLKKIKDTIIHAFDGEDEFIKSIIKKNKLISKCNFEDIEKTSKSINDFLHCFLYVLRVENDFLAEYFPKNLFIDHDDSIFEINFEKLGKKKIITLNYPEYLWTGNLPKDRDAIFVKIKDLSKTNSNRFRSGKSFAYIDWPEERIPKKNEEILLAFEPYLEDLMRIYKILSKIRKEKKEWQKANIPNAPLEKLIKQSIPPHQSFVFNSQGILTEGKLGLLGFDMNKYPQIKSFLPDHLQRYLEKDQQVSTIDISYGKGKSGSYIDTKSSNINPFREQLENGISYLVAPNLKEPLLCPTSFSVWDDKIKKWIELAKGQKYVGGKVEGKKIIEKTTSRILSKEQKIKKIKDTMLHAFDNENPEIKNQLNLQQYDLENIKEAHKAIYNFLKNYAKVLDILMEKKGDFIKKNCPKDFSIKSYSFIHEIDFKNLKKQKKLLLSSPEGKATLSITNKKTGFVDKFNSESNFFSKKSNDYQKILLDFYPFLQDLMKIYETLRNIVQKKSQSNYDQEFLKDFSWEEFKKGENGQNLLSKIKKSNDSFESDINSLDDFIAYERFAYILPNIAIEFDYGFQESDAPEFLAYIATQSFKKDGSVNLKSRNLIAHNLKTFFGANKEQEIFEISQAIFYGNINYPEIQKTVIANNISENDIDFNKAVAFLKPILENEEISTEVKQIALIELLKSAMLPFIWQKNIYQENDFFKELIDKNLENWQELNQESKFHTLKTLTKGMSIDKFKPFLIKILSSNDTAKIKQEAMKAAYKIQKNSGENNPHSKSLNIYDVLPKNNPLWNYYK